MAAGPTYEPIATYTLASNGTINFSNIPQTYTDLCIVFKGGITGYGWVFGWRYNNDSGSNYSMISMIGDPGGELWGTSVLSDRPTNTTLLNNRFANVSDSLSAIDIIDIFNYKSSTIHKSSICRTASVDAYGGLAVSAGLWRNTNPITSIELCQQTGDGNITNLFAGSKATLYGITAA